MSDPIKKEMIDPIRSKKNNNGLYIIIGFLALAVLTLGYLLFQQKGETDVITEDFTVLETEKSELESVLEGMKMQYDTMIVSNEEMRGDILQQKQEISELLERVKKLKKDDGSLRWEIGKLKKEASTLREIMKGYVHTIDSLNQKNSQLTNENTNLSSELTTVSTQKDELQNKVQDQQDIIKVGSALTANTFSAQAVRVRSNGDPKETNRASRAEMVQSCVNLAQNNITTKGSKTLYVRVISPEGAVLDDKNNIGKTFNFNGVSGKFSAKRDFNYDGNRTDLCVFHTVTSELTPGQYKVEIYESGFLIGTTSFDLR